MSCAREVQTGHQEESIQRKGGQALEQLPRDLVESLSLEMFKERLEVALSATVVLGHRLHLVISESFPTSLIL